MDNMDMTKAGIAGGVGALIVVAAYMMTFTPHLVVSKLPQTAGAFLPEVAALRLDFGPRLSAASCNGVGEPIINVAQGVKNTVDSGQAGNYWAYDDFNRTIQVWRTNAADTYCAVVKYMGNFRGIEGETSPGNTGTLTGKERGPIQGGYSALVEGTLLGSPLWNLKGNVGVADYNCDPEGNCPGAINWVTQYFEDNYSFTYNWWGWIYRAGGNKVWVNSSEGNQGDVL